MVGYAVCRASTSAYRSLQTRMSLHRSFVDGRMQQFTVLPAVVGGIQDGTPESSHHHVPRHMVLSAYPA
jgi:hypothetical protein